MKKVFICLTLLSITAAISVKIQPQNIVVRHLYKDLMKQLPQKLEKWRTLSEKKIHLLHHPPKKSTQQRSFYEAKKKRLLKQWYKLAHKIGDMYNKLTHYERMFPKLKGIQKFPIPTGVQKIDDQYRQELGSIFRLIHYTKRQKGTIRTHPGA